MSRKFVVAIPPSPVLGAVMERAARMVEAEGHRVVRPSSQADWKEQVGVIDLMLLTPRFDFDCGLVPFARNLRCVLFPTIGVDPFDVAAATAQGVLVGHSAPHAAVESMAQAAVALIASLMLRLPQKSAVLNSGRWREPYVVGRSLAGRTIGLIGYGRIGRATAGSSRAVASRASSSRTPRLDKVEKPVELLSVDDLLRESDVVSIHASRSGGAAVVIGRREIALDVPGRLSDQYRARRAHRRGCACRRARGRPHRSGSSRRLRDGAASGWEPPEARSERASLAAYGRPYGGTARGARGGVSGEPAADACAASPRFEPPIPSAWRNGETAWRRPGVRRRKLRVGMHGAAGPRPTSQRPAIQPIPSRSTIGIGFCSLASRWRRSWLNSSSSCGPTCPASSAYWLFDQRLGRIVQGLALRRQRNEAPSAVASVARSAHQSRLLHALQHSNEAGAKELAFRRDGALFDLAVLAQDP